MLRSILLYLSRSEFLQDFVMKCNLCKKASKRFIAGETLHEAVGVVKRLNEKGLTVTLDHLGESVSKEFEAMRSTSEYIEILDAIKKYSLNSNISLKLTGLGIDVDQELCVRNLEGIIGEAEKYNNFVRIDMESSAYIQRTIDIYLKLRKIHDNFGIVIQSYLYRSEKDILNLIHLVNTNIRLVKGAYKEPKEVAFPKKKDVDNSYLSLTDLLLSKKALDNKVYTAFATHDEKIIEYIENQVSKNNISFDKFEFQMLYGIRRDLQEELVKEGYKVRVYTPFGTEWYPYFMRRLAERPANLWFLIKNLLR